MNWIAEQFEKLKARVEAHIPAVHGELTSLGARVSGVEIFTGQAVTSIENRCKALELKVAELSQAKAAP
jgi:hypothetical protein